MKRLLFPAFLVISTFSISSFSQALDAGADPTTADSGVCEGLAHLRSAGTGAQLLSGFIAYAKLPIATISRII